MTRRLFRYVRSSVRFKLLALVFFPILLAVPLVTGLSFYWVQRFTYDQLFIKVNTDLAVARDVFQRIQRHQLVALQGLADSFAFRTRLEQGDWAGVQAHLHEFRAAKGFTYVIPWSPDRGELVKAPMSVPGPSHPTPPSPLLQRLWEPGGVAGVEILSRESLEAIDSVLALWSRLDVVPTERARAVERPVEQRGMVIRAFYPVRDTRGEVRLVLEGGLLLNRNLDFVDAIRDLVYGPGSLPEGSLGTVTLFLDEVRISTNVPLRPGERALGTISSEDVREAVLERGEVWVERAFVVNDMYVSAHEAITDVHGERVGMLSTGFPEAPFRDEMMRALTVLLTMFALIALLSAWLAIRGAKSIFRPIELMTGVARATRRGEQNRVGPVPTRDELGELAREFDAMLDLLRDQQQLLQNWADELELKVDERTAEIIERNRELERTINLLRETRRQLVVSEKLAALGELTAGVAHEINNPVAVILGNMEVIISEMGNRLEPVREEARLIIEQVDRMREIVNKLLQYARPSDYAGHLEEIDVNAAIADTLPLVQYLVKRHSTTVKLDLKAAIPVQINRQELQQVLLNLIVNAVQAMREDGGTLEIGTDNWDGRGVILSVRDNGCGIAAENLARVFDPFFTTKKQGQGTGLGLSVSYSLMRHYGGNITVRSEEGQWTEFRVWILAEPEFVDVEETLMEKQPGCREESGVRS